MANPKKCPIRFASTSKDIDFINKMDYLIWLLPAFGLWVALGQILIGNHLVRYRLPREGYFRHAILWPKALREAKACTEEVRFQRFLKNHGWKDDESSRAVWEMCQSFLDKRR